MTSHEQWEGLSFVCDKLVENSFKALLAGGCVRDALLGVKAKDFDVASDATPDEVLKLFPNAIDVGKAFGVMIIPFEGYQIEVTRFRMDEAYKDGRHPTKVSFSSEKEDAKRRDFTINALFFDYKEKKIIDYVDGLSDLKKKRIKAIGLAEERFNEDHLRVLRGIRFKAQLGFEIEEGTEKAIRDCLPKVQKVSNERIREEFLKLLMAEDAIGALGLLYGWQAFAWIVPSFHRELQKLNEEARDELLEVSSKTLPRKMSQSNLEREELFVRFFLPFLNLQARDGSPFSFENFLEGLKTELVLSKTEAATLSKLWNLLLQLPEWESENLDSESKVSALEKCLYPNVSANESLRYLIALLDRIGYSQWGALKGFASLLEALSSVINSDQGFPDKIVSFDDIQSMQLPKGPAIQETLHRAFCWQIVDPSLSKEDILSRLS